MTRSMASDDDCDFSVLFASCMADAPGKSSGGFSANMVANVTKYGTMAKKSIAFIMSCEQTNKKVRNFTASNGDEP